MKHTFDRAAHQRMKKELAQLFPEIPARMRAEALARGLGHKNASALKACLNVEGSESVLADTRMIGSFSEYLVDIGAINGGDINQIGMANRWFVSVVSRELKSTGRGMWFVEAEDGNRFQFSDKFKEIDRALNAILDEYDIGVTQAPPEYEYTLRDFAFAHRTFPDGWAHLAAYWMHEGEASKAETYASVGVDVCERVLPKNYSGQLLWIELNNRPYHRCLRILVNAYEALGEPEKSEAMKSKLRQLDPRQYIER